MNITVELLKRSLIRALHTMAQTAIGMIAVGRTLTDINWINVLSVAAVAAIVSFLKSIVIGIPEVYPEAVDGTTAQETPIVSDPVTKEDPADNKENFR